MFAAMWAEGFDVFESMLYSNSILKEMVLFIARFPFVSIGHVFFFLLALFPLVNLGLTEEGLIQLQLLIDRKFVESLWHHILTFLCGPSLQLSGMATKVQIKSYLPGYYHLQDVKEDASSWTSCYQDEKLSEHLYNSYVPRSVNDSAQDRDMLKRTMLEHEAIFRRQVYELHRLYRIQKDLMNEYQTRGFDGSSILAEASHSNSFSSQMHSECNKNMSSQKSHFPIGRISCRKTPFGGTEKNQFCFTGEGSIRSDQIPVLNEASRKDTKALDCQSLRRRMFDLQLPADEYIDIEDTDGYGLTNIAEVSPSASILKNGTCSLYSENDVKLSLGSNHREDCHISNSPTQICKKRSTVEFFAHTSNNGNVGTSCETLQSNIKKCPKIFSLDHNNPGTCSRQEPTHSIQTSIGVPHCTCSNSTLLSPLVPSSITTSETNLTSHASSFVSSWGIPATGINNKLIALQALPSFSGSSNPSNENLISKIDAQTPIDCEKWQSDGNQNTSLVSGTGVSRTNGFHQYLHLDSNSASAPHPKLAFKPDQIDGSTKDLHGHLPGRHVKSFLSRDIGTPININLNQAFATGVEERLAVRQDAVICDVDRKDDKLSGGLSCLRIKPSSNESVYLKKHAAKVDLSICDRHPPLSSSLMVVAPQIERKGEMELDFSLCQQQDVASNSQFKDNKMQQNQVSDSCGKRILIDNTSQQSSMLASVQHMKQRHLTDNAKSMENYNMIFSDLGHETKVLNSQEKIHIGCSFTEICSGKSRASFRKHINLNAEFACTDDPISPDILTQGEIAVRSSHYTPRFGAKSPSGIDLEVPISQDETVIYNQHKYIPLSKNDGSQEKDNSGDILVRFAAENLVSISMDCRGRSDEINSHQLSLPGLDTLSWFAEVVSCSAENPKLPSDGGDVGTRSSDDHGYDFFEVMTLSLEEIKMDKHCSRPKELESKDKKEDKDDIGAASLLFTKPRHGHARKRRQRRDFQKDILPGLASLSRHEVSEDLQTIGGMMKASGGAWQTGLTRRNTSRSGLNPQTKGRRQSRSLAITTEEIQVSPSTHSQPSNCEIGVSERCMIGWGRTTRRCRTQRCPPGSLPAP
ncbi:hypothetical protein MUK42_11008 [Musa troglodytarum]|uniref:Uncharacterized protein n=1 Tax=Musa troglodytarum TaxID=320322 RepID=A0A9E7KJA9_9LILI|nr:hypothetical protein MUK42_11008 [Musa troglodytarum]